MVVWLSLLVLLRFRLVVCVVCLGGCFVIFVGVGVRGYILFCVYLVLCFLYLLGWRVYVSWLVVFGVFGWVSWGLVCLVYDS